MHRNLKPENVLISADGRAKLADFGIAKATTDLGAGRFRTSTRMMIATPAYMAPEQAMGEDVGPWTDLYSAGRLAHELLTGQRPFHDVEAPMAILMRHATEPIPPASALVPDLDPRLSDWVAKLVQKDRRRRRPRGTRSRRSSSTCSAHAGGAMRSCCTIRVRCTWTPTACTTRRPSGPARGGGRSWPRGWPWSRR